VEGRENVIANHWLHRLFLLYVFSFHSDRCAY
jgi:hypothetical protein